jgi:hypothetical protein
MPPADLIINPAGPLKARLPFWRRGVYWPHAGMLAPHLRTPAREDPAMASTGSALEPSDNILPPGSSFLKRRVMSVAGLVGFVIPFIIFGVWTWSEWTALRAFEAGAKADAVVLSSRVDEDSEGDDYYITYQFKGRPSGGVMESYEHEADVRQATYERYGPGDPVAIRYNQADPRRSWLEDEPPNPVMPALMMGAYVVIDIIAIAIMFFVLRRTARRAEELETGGVTSRATLTDLHEENDGESASYRATVRIGEGDHALILVKRIDGALYRRLHQRMRMAGGEPLTVTVRYLPSNPRQSRIEA